MSNLIGNLIGASKALQAHQTGVATAGKNLANVNNPDYARQRVVLGDRFVAETAQGPVSSGVEALSIRQIRDQFLDVAVVREKSLSGELVAQQSILDRAEANLGEAINRSEDSAAASDQSHSRAGISNSINDFFNGFDDVAASPLDVGAKQVLLQKADILANKFNVTDQRLSDLQADITTQIGTDVT